MPDLGIFGWIIIGLIAGALAGALVPGRQARPAWAPCSSVSWAA